MYRFKGAPIDTRDSKKLGVVSLKEVFAHSSNIGIGRLITNYYNNNPQKFIDRLHDFGLGSKSSVDLIGVPAPKIISPTNDSWSGISLPWMSFGYGINLTALDILTFYNTVANDGYIVHPYLGFAFREGSKLVEIKRDQLSHRICSKSTIQKVKDLLREVVQNGTGKQLSNLPFPVSGKTGTTVKNYNHTLTSGKQYQASFVGFFPSDKPQYSCIVLIDDPNPKKGYYGSQVAVPVFKEIARKIYIEEDFAWTNNNTFHLSVDNYLLSNKLHNYDNLKDSIYVEKNTYPNVVGLHLRDAINVLESAGYKIIIQGQLGKVKKQYPKQNSPVRDNIAITLFS